ncbi:MAG: TFIIB-type zinc ribbon-containing protein [Thermoprotei archaeon]
MNTSQDTCPTCGSKNIIRDEKGQLTCHDCGTVIDSRITVVNYKIVEDQLSGEGRGPPRNIMYPSSISDTVFSLDNKYVENRRISLKMMRGIQRLRTLQSKMQLMRRHERHLSRVLNEIQTIVNQLKLSRQVEENASYIYREYMKKKGSSKSRSIRGAAAAAVFIASRLAENPVTIEELSKSIRVSKRDINKCYKILLPVIFERRPDLISKLHGSPEHHVSQIVSRLNLPIEVQAKANEILKNANKVSIMSGKEPRGLAAAAVYIASILTNNKRTQHEIAEAARITEVTIRNRYKELMSALDIKYSM